MKPSRSWKLPAGFLACLACGLGVALLAVAGGGTRAPRRAPEATSSPGASKTEAGLAYPHDVAAVMSMADDYLRKIDAIVKAIEEPTKSIAKGGAR